MGTLLMAVAALNLKMNELDGLALRVYTESKTFLIL